MMIVVFVYATVVGGDSRCKSGRTILYFKMADEVVREYDPNNRMLMDEIRTYRAIYDDSCHEHKDQRVKKNVWQAPNKLSVQVHKELHGKKSQVLEEMIC